MAKLEQLLQGVKDAKLRAELEAEVVALKDRTRFGLVYERHLPETVIVGDTDGLKIGDHVRPREEANNGEDYRLVDLTGDQATILSLKTNEERQVPFVDLLAVRRFGDPADVGLTPLGSVERNADRPYHAVIDGENFHTLRLLTFIYERQVDCIYIDPPYNTGARDWTYNNRFVDATDSYRHSKWLSMMEKRLRLAKRLLKPDGVLIVTIDENERSHLGLLLEELFAGHQRYQVIIVINPKGVSKANFARVEEYAIYCVPKGKDLIAGQAVALRSDDNGNGEDLGEVEDGEWGLVRRRGSESRRSDRPSMFYPIYIDEAEKRIVEVGTSIPLEKEPDLRLKGGLRPVWPIDGKGQHRRWQLGADTMRAQLEAGHLALGRYNKKLDSWTINLWRPKKTRKRLKTVWWEKRHDAGTHGTNVVDAFLGRDRSFPFPKSLYAVRDCIAAVCLDRPDALIVDFFAGSGTTLHATCLLNNEDGGQRRCILVTNNEVDPETRRKLKRQGHHRGTPEYERHGIFEAVARPRVEAALTGRRPDGKPAEGNYLDGGSYADGFEENVEFFRLDYLDSDRVEIGECFEAIHAMLWLAAGGRGQRPEVKANEPFLINAAGGYAVLFEEDAFRDFEEALRGHEDVSHVAFVTDSDEAYAEMRERVGTGRQTVMLYRDFLRHYRRRVRL